MKHRLFHCWDCGQRVIAQDGADGHLKPMPCLQQVQFRLSNGAYMVNPFCRTCAEREWTPERLAEFKAAILRIAPEFSEVTINACEGPVPTSAIRGVVQ